MTNGYHNTVYARNLSFDPKTFSYDNQGRLANADIPGVNRTDYGYDWVGNRTSPTAAYNDADQLTSYSGNTYNYNTYGDMTSGAGRTYTTADSGRVWRIAYNSVNYDNYFTPMGLRYTSTAGAVSTNYVYDITAGIPAVVAEANGGTVTSYYVREPGGELVMRQNGEDKKYYHFDELGSTLFLTDASGVQTDKYVYNAWGKVVSSSGSTVNPYKYVGRLGYYSDAGIGLLSLGARFYDPEAGVFTQRDSAKDGLSYYAYTSGKVMTAVDPWGNVSVEYRCSDPMKAQRMQRAVERVQRCIASSVVEDPYGNLKDGIKKIIISCDGPQCQKNEWLWGYTDAVSDFWGIMKGERYIYLCDITFYGKSRPCKDGSTPLEWAVQSPSVAFTMLHELYHLTTIVQGDELINEHVSQCFKNQWPVKW